jgi:hypothetical protein
MNEWVGVCDWVGTWTPGKAAALFEAGGDQVIEAVDWFAG